jgi:hypothetical protein
VLLDALWPAPAGLPARWPSEERAAAAWALFKRRAPAPTRPPALEWLGVAGTTELPLTLEPGACYLAALAVGQGSALGARLAIAAGGVSYYDDAVEVPRGAVVTFCAGSERSARATVDLRARAAVWRLALWRLGEAPLRP